MKDTQIYMPYAAKETKSKNSLLISWSAERDKSEAELQWDLCIAPLIFGPIAVLDNMVCDNYALYNFLLKERHQRILSYYVRRGWIQLWHRESLAGRQIGCMEDILKDWLCRRDEHRIKDVEFGILHRVNKKTINEILRSKIREWNDKPSISDYTRLESFYEIMHGNDLPFYKHYIGLLNSIFFIEGKERGIGIYPRYPEPLKYRFLESLGISDSKEMISNSKENELFKLVLVEIEKKRLTVNAKLPLHTVQKFCQLGYSDTSVQEFFRVMVSDNPNVTELKDICRKFENSLSLDIENVLTDAYDMGIAEANRAIVIGEAIKRNMNSVNLEFGREMSKVLDSIELKLKDEQFINFFQHDPVSMKDYRNRINRLIEVLELPKQDDISIESLENIKRLLACVSVGAAGFSFDFAISVFIAFIGSRLGDDTVDYGAMLYKKICKNEQNYYKLLPTFYKYGEFRIKSANVISTQ